MSKKVETNIPSVNLSTLETLINKIKKETKDDAEISIEFIIASLFPSSWNSIQKALSEQHTQGYIQGYKDAKDEYKIRASLSSKDDADCYCE